MARQPPLSARSGGSLNLGRRTCVYLIMPTSDTACFQIYLNVLSRKYRKQHILLVLDGAPNHRCGKLTVPDNVSLLFLPPDLPELSVLGRRNRGGVHFLLPVSEPVLTSMSAICK